MTTSTYVRHGIPQYNRILRAYRYIMVMFPPWTLVPIGLVQFISLYFGIQALSDVGTMRLTLHGVVGAFSTTLWMLLVRLQDDLADSDADIRLGLAGDPRYQNRPIVTGHITVRELHIMFRFGFVLLLAINAVFGASFGFLTCVVGFGITWLGFRWFFIPQLAAHPTPQAYLLRKSLTLLLGLYALGVFVDDFGRPSNVVAIVLLLLAPTAGVAAWEVARKIRVPEDETDYETYSKAFGWRVASLLPAVFVAMSLACLAPVAIIAEIHWTFLAILAVAAMVTIGGCLRFRFVPTRRHARLESFAQIYGAVAHGGLAVALALTYGVIVL